MVKGDHETLMKMFKDDPKLSRAKDFTTGYTPLHWAAKHGSLELVKILAENYKVDVNAKSYGGYTPSHLACQFGHQQVFNILVRMYRADVNLQDHCCKKPSQYFASDWKLKLIKRRSSHI